MGEEEKKKLEQQLWNIANELRGKMNPDEFRDYILGFIFYKYLSEKMESFANELLEEDEVLYSFLENTEEDKEYLEAIKEDSIEELGYFLYPWELFSAVAKRGNSDTNSFILEDLTTILRHIEQSTMGHESEDDFEHLFEDLDLTSTKLGKTEDAKNTLVSKILFHLDSIDFELKNHDRDVLGDAYEYLIGMFASGAGKKAGEFYTPKEVSTVLAKIVTNNKSKLKSVYDPTCGSGSLLLRVGREVNNDVSDYYGQELNRTTYNLARMNMIMHDIHYRKFDIKQEDTLENPQHLDKRFEAIVANPPFSAQWSANPLHLSDDRFSQYGKLAPKSKADYAFVTHMIHQLDENGTMAVVLPHGVLFRGGSEGHIRRYLIEDRNYLDCVIGLPANIFYGTEIPTCILVFKKCREDNEHVLFIDASSKEHFEKAKNQNYLREQDIEKIISTFKERKTIDRYSSVVTLEKIEENDYNLNIPRYVDTFEEEKYVDIEIVSKELKRLYEKSNENDKTVLDICKELNISKPIGNNLFLLEEYKKGVMQQIFSQEIRFKKDDGSEFEDWKKIKLKEVLFEHKTRNTENKITEVFSVAKTKGVINQIEHLGRSYASSDLTNYKIIFPNDIVYTKSPTSDFPYGIIKQNKLTRAGVVSTLYAVFKPSNRYIGSFLDYYFSSWVNTYNYLNPLVHKGAKNTMNINNDDFLNGEEIFMPTSEEEQIKIVNFLGLLDKKIIFNKEYSE